MCYERRRAEACVDVGPVRNPVLLHRVAPCFPWFLSFGNRTQNSRVAGASPTTSPSGDLIPTIRGSGAHPGCVFVYQGVFYYCRTYYKAVRVGGVGPVRNPVL